MRSISITRSPSNLFSALLVAGFAIGFLVFCTGDDPQAVRECIADAECGPGRSCDLTTNKCVGGVADGGPGGADVGTDGGSSSSGSNVIVLGQPDEFSNIENELGVSLPLGVSINKDGKLAILEYANQRVGIWNTIPTTNLKRADNVVGMPNLKTVSPPPTTAETFYPGYFCDALSIVGERLFIADTNRQRGLIWNILPTTDFRAADMVVGASDFTSTPTSALPVSSQTLAAPCAVTSDGTRLFVADHNNHRVLVWNKIPTIKGEPANFALGQDNLTSNTNACPNTDTMACFNVAASVYSNGTSLWVTDYDHNRVLQWNVIPDSGRAPADVVIGQPNPTSFGANTNGISASTLRSPRRVFTHGTRLFVVDQGNNRVLIWNTIPTTNGQAADVIVGQPDATSSTLPTAPDAKVVNAPMGVASDGVKLVVSDYGFDRVLIWNTIPTTNFAPADAVVGRPSMTATRVREPDAKTFQPSTAYTDGTRFFVAEVSRILIWDHTPTGPLDAATMVLGQSDFTTIIDDLSKPLTPTRFHRVRSLWSDATRLVAADTFANRVLIWNKPITTNNQPADLVLGQLDFGPHAPNEKPLNEPPPRNPPTAKRLWNPNSITSDGTRLAIADGSNNRVLIWNTFPTQMQQPADLVIGQADMDNGFPNREGAAAANTLSSPQGIFYDGTSLLVADTSNNRVLVFNKGWPATGASADVVIGQPDLAASTANNGGISAKSMNHPDGITVRDGRLYVADKGNHRVLYWEKIPTDNGHAADGVYGQPNFTTSDSNSGGLGPRSLSEPSVTSTSAGRLWIADHRNNRVVGLPIP